MNESTRESKFLDAINRYAEKQKQSITKEVEVYKSQRIEQATAEGLKDAYDLIQKDITTQKADIVASTAQEKSKIRTDLLLYRQKIANDIFHKVEHQLISYTGSKEYDAKLREYADHIAKLFNGAPCVIHLAPKDERLKEMILSRFDQATLEIDHKIRIGGIKAECASLGIIADETLDAKMNEQREWFYENSGLKVV